MGSENVPPSPDVEDRSALNGVSGWLMFFVIIFFLNALNLLSMPFTVRIINWDYLWQENQAITTYFAVSQIAEFVGAILALVAAVLILKRQKSAIIAVNIYCILLIAVSLAGMTLSDEMGSMIEKGLPVVSFVNLSQQVPDFLDLDFGSLLGTSLIMGFGGIIVAAVVIFLYFRLSQRVKVTLSQ